MSAQKTQCLRPPAQLCRFTSLHVASVILPLPPSTSRRPPSLPRRQRKRFHARVGTVKGRERKGGGEMASSERTLPLFCDRRRPLLRFAAARRN